MARFQSPPENTVQVPLTRRRVVLLFIGQLVLLSAAFLLGLWIGRGQRYLEEPSSIPTTPPPVITEPGPPVTALEDHGAPSPASPSPAPSTSSPSPPPSGPAASAVEKTPSAEPPSSSKAASVPPPPGPPSAGPSEKSPAPGGFVLQVVALRDSAKAHALVEKLKGLGLPAYMEPSARGLYRVRVGPYRTREEAERAILQVLKVVPDSKPVVQGGS